jgi:hypothetical protein
MKKGWKTWATIVDHDDRITYKGKFAFNNTDEKDQLYIEDNKYRITFLRSAFEECDISPYKRKLRENKRKREEVITLSEITHKIKLISI